MNRISGYLPAKNSFFVETLKVGIFLLWELICDFLHLLFEGGGGGGGAPT